MQKVKSSIKANHNDIKQNNKKFAPNYNDQTQDLKNENSMVELTN